jgi:hypothetical protein
MLIKIFIERANYKNSGAESNKHVGKIFAPRRRKIFARRKTGSPPWIISTRLRAG